MVSGAAQQGVEVPPRGRRGVGDTRVVGRGAHSTGRRSIHGAHQLDRHHFTLVQVVLVARTHPALVTVEGPEVRLGQLVNDTPHLLAVRVNQPRDAALPLV